MLHAESISTATTTGLKELIPMSLPVGGVGSGDNREPVFKPATRIALVETGRKGMACIDPAKIYGRICSPVISASGTSPV